MLSVCNGPSARPFGGACRPDHRSSRMVRGATSAEPCALALNLHPLENVRRAEWILAGRCRAEWIRAVRCPGVKRSRSPWNVVASACLRNSPGIRSNMGMSAGAEQGVRTTPPGDSQSRATTQLIDGHWGGDGDSIRRRSPSPLVTWLTHRGGRRRMGRIRVSG